MTGALVGADHRDGSYVGRVEDAVLLPVLSLFEVLDTGVIAGGSSCAIVQGPAPVDREPPLVAVGRP